MLPTRFALAVELTMTLTRPAPAAPPPRALWASIVSEPRFVVLDAATETAVMVTPLVLEYRSHLLAPSSIVTVLSASDTFVPFTPK
jgi:hypothetical protein